MSANVTNGSGAADIRPTLKGVERLPKSVSSPAQEKPRPQTKQAGADKEKNLSLRDRAYEALKERIITLHFQPGQYVNEADVAASLGFGRTPIHQAFQRLELEGLVQIMPRKGIIVRPHSIAEILKILDSRVVVEPELARGAAKASDHSTIEKLVELATATEVNTEAPDIAIFTVNDRSFHGMIADMSENEVLADFSRTLHERCIRFWHLHMWQTIDIASSNAQHLEIARCIAKRDGDQAAKAMASHIQQLQSRLQKLKL